MALRPGWAFTGVETEQVEGHSFRCGWQNFSHGTRLALTWTSIMKSTRRAPMRPNSDVRPQT